jgi:hypothetical protein
MTAYAIDQTITPLSEIDAQIDRTSRGALTLDPDRPKATALSTLVAGLADSQQLPHLAAAASAVATAQLRSFPENLLWDFDFYLASIHAEACAAEDYASHIENLMEITVGLMRMYGQQSAIRFRYVHDFMYGFDWARWVRRDRDARPGTGPFSLEFLKQIETRGRDILTLIEADDPVYPKLTDAASRNPFSFSREPDDELRLYRLLAERDCVPVEAWRLDAHPDASRDFDALREEAAQGLGLGR